jgi:hypothetical protein
MHLRYLSERLEDLVESGEGNAEKILDEAAELLELGQNHYPDILRGHPEIQGMLGDVLARRQQEKFMTGQQQESDARGCLLGWLFRKKDAGS